MTFHGMCAHDAAYLEHTLAANVILKRAHSYKPVHTGIGSRDGSVGIATGYGLHDHEGREYESQ
jgi:hypothetical protein